jgi:hypothetical protein
MRENKGVGQEEKGGDETRKKNEKLRLAYVAQCCAVQCHFAHPPHAKQ